MAERCVAIVDGFASGRYLPSEFARFGVTSVSLQSLPEIPAALRPSFAPENFARNLGHFPRFDDAVAACRALDPIAVIPGTETGVEYADAIAHALGLRTNALHLSVARRDKHTMIEAIAAAGLHCARQIRATDAEQAVAWARAEKTWPLVLKPLRSAGSEGVVYCHDEAELAAAFAAVTGKENLLGAVNGELVVQSFLDGPQYMVNSVSHEGRHFCGDVWRLNTRRVKGASVAIEDYTLLPPDDDTVGEIVRYNEKALDALGIAYGPSCAELMLTRRGPALIECAARIMGPTIERDEFFDSMGHSPVSLTAECYADPQAFARRGSGRYRIKQAMAIVFFLFEEHGIIRSHEGLDRLKTLRSFRKLAKVMPIGTRFEPTRDSVGRPGFVYLMHEDMDQVLADRDTVRAWEDAGVLYGYDVVHAEPAE
jgi:hypothetical protein